MKYKSVLIAILVSFLILGCAKEDKEVNPIGVITFTDDLGREVTFNNTAKRIVSLAPSLTETLFAIGVGKKVVGVTVYCDYPEEVKKLPKIGGYINPSVEKIVNLKPDVVLATRGSPLDILRKLENLGIKVFAFQHDSFADYLGDIMVMGRIVGEPVGAKRLVYNLKERVRGVQRRLAYARRRPKVLWVSWLEPLYIAGSHNLTDETIRLAGGENVGGKLNNPYPQVSLEFVVKSNPDYIILAPMEGHKVGEEELERRRGWRDLPAVKGGQVKAIIPHEGGRPRMVDDIEEMARLLHSESF